MLKRIRFSLAASLAAVGVAGAVAQPLPVPRGATIGPQGFATIMEAPPAPFTAVAPAPPPPLTPEQIAEQDKFRRVGEFQNRIRAEVERLAARLRRAEPANFVDLYYDNEGEPGVVFRFLRDGPATLRKYSRNPVFSGETTRYSKSELKAALEFMMATFRNDRVIEGGGYGNREGRAVIDLNVTEAEFRALVARKGVKIPPAVKLNFMSNAVMRPLNRPLQPGIARLVRLFPRNDRPLGAVNAINSNAKVVLRDGCFRVPDQGNAFALFPLGASLFIDREGYLAFGGPDVAGYGRVGETLVFPGSIVEITAPELVGPIHAACGPGKVVGINATMSAAADRAQSAATQNAWALKELKESYGLADAEARLVLERCLARSQFGSCHMSPPPPVRNASECPAGTKLSFGLCRTPAGVIRPRPQWIDALLKG